MLNRLLGHPVRLIAFAVVLLFALYEISVQLFAYSGDAYDTSDVVVLSAEVAGPISAIHVEDNAVVAAGDKLFEIDPTAYSLAVDESQAALAQAEAGLALAVDEVAVAKAELSSAQAVQDNANQTLSRSKDLSKDGFSTEASLDIAMRDAAQATASLLVAQSGLGAANQRVAVSTANLAAARAALAKARYQLSKTAIVAPDAGQIAPFNLRRGDYLQLGTEVMAIVTAARRRIVVNMPERHLSHIRPGQRAWVTLGSDPWHIHTGRVTGIAAGIARTADAATVLPYVQPTTDWVRLPRRFPVEIALDEPSAGLPHHLGADARVLIWF